MAISKDDILNAVAELTVLELVELIAHAREEQFTPAELDVQLSGLLNSLLGNSVLDGDEHVALVSEVFRRVPELFVL